jgi:hypothetical protein
MAAHHSTLGAKLGPRIARVVVDAQADHLRKTAGTRANIEAAALHKFWRDIGDEKAGHLGPLYDLLKGHPDTHPAAERMIHFMGEHRGELAGMLTERTVGQATAMGIGSGLAALLSPINQRLLEELQTLPLGIGDAVQLSVSGVWDDAAARTEAARNGINTQRYEALRDAAFTWPGLPEVIDLWRRGQITEAQAAEALQRAGLDHDWCMRLLALKRQPIMPADAALMVLRGIIDQAEGHAIGAESGYTPTDFDRLTLATGEPPGAESLMEALRRGFIDNTRFAHGIRQSRIRNEWIGLMEQLRFEPMATADAVEAVVRGYLTAPEGEAIALQNGLEARDWSTLLLAHGRPPGLGQMQQLLNRGLVSQAQVDQAVRESDIKDKYVPMVRGLRWRIPSERLLVTMVQHNGISTERAHELLQKEGYEPDVAGAIIKTGAAQRTGGHKELALSTVLDLYESHAIDQAQAEAHLKALGYPAEDIPLLLKHAELKRELRWREAAIGSIRSGFVGHHITEAEAATLLANAGVPSGQISYLTRLWVIERSAHRKSLTEAQIIHSMRQGHLSPQEAESRLQGQGYGPNDAAFLIQSAGPIPKGA